MALACPASFARAAPGRGKPAKDEPGHHEPHEVRESVPLDAEAVRELDGRRIERMHVALGEGQHADILPAIHELKNGREVRSWPFSNS